MMDNDVSLYSFVQWLQKHSNEVGYSRLIYLYSDDGLEAKRFLTRLMYFDSLTQWPGDCYVEFCSARCFCSRIHMFRKGVEDGSRVSLDPSLPSQERLMHSNNMAYVRLALLDIQELADDDSSLEEIFDTCRVLAEEKAYVLISGTDYPSKIFKDNPAMARFLLDGYVGKISGNSIIFGKDGPIRIYNLPFSEELRRNDESKDDAVSSFSLDNSGMLFFQWEMLCTWKSKYSFFDYDLFKGAYYDAWQFLLTKGDAEEYPERCRLRCALLALLGGFIEGDFSSILSLFTHELNIGTDLVYGNRSALEASACFTRALLFRELNSKLYKDDGILEVGYWLREDVTDFFHGTRWKSKVSLPQFRIEIDDLTCELEKVSKIKKMGK